MSVEEELEACNDIEGVLNVSALPRDETLQCQIGESDFRPLPVPCRIRALGWYHARPLLKDRFPRDYDHTDKVLDLKQVPKQDERFLEGPVENDTITYFYNRLHPILRDGFPITIVPAHDPLAPNWGLIKLVRRLSSDGRIDATSCIIRSRRISSQHFLCGHARCGISRQQELLDSIEIRDRSLIDSKVVLLLDDIVTTGASLMACKKLLLDAGAVEVICLALGKAAQ